MPCVHRTERLRQVLFGSAAFRMALWQAALFMLLAAALLGVVWQRVNVYAAYELHDKVATELASLRQADADGTLLIQLRQRLLQHPQGPDYYLLADSRGTDLLGNLRYHPARLGWQSVPLRHAVGRDSSDADRVQLFVTRLAHGRWLAVGRDNRQVVELGEVLGKSFIELCALAIALVLLSGGLASWRYLRRIDALGEQAERILEGATSITLRGSGRGDEIDRLARRLNRLLNRVHALMQGLRQVSQDIAHDLRTPLTRTRQQLEASLEAHPGDVPRAAVTRAINEVDAALETFAALLRIASIEARQRRSGFVRVELSAIVGEVLDIYRPVAEDSGHTLAASITAGLTGHADRALLVQMLANLLDNALTHTPAGTSVYVTLSTQDSRPLLRISDSGPGIPAADLDRVVQRFVRLDRSRSTPGSGLGLSLVAAICDLHGIALSLADAHPGLELTCRFPHADLQPANL